MKSKLAIIALVTIATALVAQEVATFSRFRQINTIPAGLRNALNNTADSIKAARTNSERTVIRIMVEILPSNTNITASVEETVPFREVQ